MLINEPNMMNRDPLLDILAASIGRSGKAKRLRDGVYEIGHFGISNFLRGYEEYPETTVGSYGVCDNVEQLLAACPELEAPGREFVVTVTPIFKADQPEEGGWRWHKWGQYIGHQNSQCEYIYDEPEIDEVLCFHIYEKLNQNKGSGDESI